MASFLAGVALGRLTAPPGAGEVTRGPPNADPSTQSSREPGAAERAIAEALGESWLSIARLSAQVDSLEALVDALREQGLDPARLVQSDIAHLSDGQLRSIVASAVHLGPQELDEVRDLRTFAGRLAEVAMEGVLEPDGQSRCDDRVLLSASPESVDPEAVARDRFPADQRRIYALFPTDRYDEDAVMVKWYRRDRPRILLFERYPISPGERYGYVWLQPRRGWEPGEYQVDVYATDEAVTLLSRGSYTVDRAE